MVLVNDSGYLAVTVQPASQLDQVSFSKWCNDENRLSGLQLPADMTGEFYNANDGLKPKWSISYDVPDLSSWGQLMTSPLLSRQDIPEALESLEWKVYKTLSTRGDIPGPGPIQVAVTMTVKAEDQEDFNRWYEEEHTDMLSKIPGWLRSRRFQLVHAGPENMPTAGQVEYLAVHDYTANNGQGGKEHQAARNTPWRTRVLNKVVSKHTREWRLDQNDKTVNERN